MTSSTSREPAPIWSDLAELLDEIRSPQRADIEATVREACGDEAAPLTVARIADAVFDLYRRGRPE